MHGLMNRAVQDFLTVTYGEAAWRSIAAEAGVPERGFEALLTYDDALIGVVLRVASRRLRKRSSDLLEDMGTFLVSHPRMERVRRLLRFGGSDFDDFLQSLEDLPARAELALPTLDAIPRFVLRDDGRGRFLLTATYAIPGISHIMMGALRAIADDYGALVLIEAVEPAEGRPDDGESVRITLSLADFRAGRGFDLAGSGEGRGG
ncbi:heme-NO-binding protein [Hasllibacter halocynthiae]|uniref:Heme-NO-binding protein n=1 Tax=Hasllibacter halocynthiae TaxID=595589 RepID=A0A2T0X7A6_9RHOB|nr:heme NO-binding domain-containing protein [Hasllibacter halocynthiae]PRY94828.1 heme-NO-binding protein [Hasllibacter halocynthiae]